MDEKGRAMQGRLDFCERNVKTLQQGVKALLKNHKEGCEATLDLSQRIRDTAAQEQFIDLQEDLIAIAECTKRLAEERRMIMVSLYVSYGGGMPNELRHIHNHTRIITQCERAEERVVSTIQFIQERVLHPTKLLLKDRERVLHKYYAMERKIGCK
jgi:hypothetical protein